MHSLQSFATPVQAMVVGASGAIGSAIARRLDKCANVANILATARKPPSWRGDKITWRELDILNEQSISTALESVDRLDLVIVATGFLHGSSLQPEKTWRSLDAFSMLLNFEINCVGPAMIAKHVLPRISRQERAVFAALSARVGSNADNRLGGWYSYRASKAALNQFMKTLSIELARSHPHCVCLGLHPGTVNSSLSKPFQTSVSPEQLIDPATAAERLLEVIDKSRSVHSGKFLSWNGAVIPP